MRSLSRLQALRTGRCVEVRLASGGTVDILCRTKGAGDAALNASASWDVRRFRPNFLIEPGPESPAHVERSWVGRTVQIGGSAIRGEMPTIRCAMTMHSQKDLPQDPSVHRTIVREADQCLGLYASIVATGSISVGDPVSIA